MNEIVREAVEEQRQLAPTRTIQLHQASTGAVVLLVDADRIRRERLDVLVDASLQPQRGGQTVAVGRILTYS